jgi:hypothetical protein
MLCPNSWKSVTTLLCFSKLSFFGVSFEKLQTSAVAKYLLVLSRKRNPSWRLKLAAAMLLVNEIDETLSNIRVKLKRQGE